MTNDLQSLLVANGDSLRECITAINANGKRIVLVVDSEQRLSGPVTYGDIRRAILDNISLEETGRTTLYRGWGVPAKFLKNRGERLFPRFA